MNNPLLSVQEVSKLLGVDEQMIYRFIREGKLKATRVSRFWRVKYTDLAECFGLGQQEKGDEPN